MECRLVDAWGKEHVIHEKIPVVTILDITPTTELPITCEIACEVLKEWEDSDGRKLVTVTTRKPWGIETIDGLHVFDFVKGESDFPDSSREEG